MIYYPNAKINLGLRIMGRRSDGFHEIQSLFLPVGWCDELEVVVNPEGAIGKLNFELTGAKIDGELDSNLVVRAHALLKEDFELPEISATLLKNIPSGAGLGGGSSNGSFMLLAINEMCDLGIENDELENYAAKLGSDCPFFITNEPAMVTGRGELIERFDVGDNLKNKDILIAYPGIGVNTRDAFAKLKLNENSAEFDFNNLSSIYNDFQKSISQSYPEVKNSLEFLSLNGAHFTQMTGSGSAVFGLFEKGKVDGEKLKLLANEEGWSAYFGALL